MHMGFFKYKWQVVVLAGVGFSLVIFMNVLIFKLFEISEIVFGFIAGFIWALGWYFIRKKEPWFQKLK